MDNRTEIITNMMMSMQTDLTSDQLRKLKDSLYIELEKYEITERSTELTVSDSSALSTLKKFIATKRLEGKSEGTIGQYVLRCSDMLNTIGKPVDEITTYDLRYYLADFQQRRKVSNRTLENVRHCITAFFTWAYGDGFITSNPANAIGSIKYEKEIRKPFSHTDMEKLRQACSCKRDRAIVEILYATGCRVSEVASLNRDDIDYQNKCVTVTGKGSKQRTVYLNDVSIMYLNDYLSSREDNDQCLFARKRQYDDMRLTVGAIEGIIRDIGKAAGVSDCHPHRFRRTLATNLISRGAAIQDVAAILGHEDISTTQIYCKIDQSDVQHSYQRCIA